MSCLSRVVVLVMYSVAMTVPVEKRMKRESSDKIIFRFIVRDEISFVVSVKSAF